MRFRRPNSDSIMGSSVVLTRAAQATPALALSTASSLADGGEGVSGELLQPARTRKKHKAEREMCMMGREGVGGNGDGRFWRVTFPYIAEGPGRRTWILKEMNVDSESWMAPPWVCLDL